MFQHWGRAGSEKQSRTDSSCDNQSAAMRWYTTMHFEIGLVQFSTEVSYVR